MGYRGGDSALEIWSGLKSPVVAVLIFGVSDHLLLFLSLLPGVFIGVQGSRVQKGELISDVASSKKPPKTHPFTKEMDPQQLPKKMPSLLVTLPGKGWPSVLAVASEGCSHLRMEHGRGASKSPSSPSREPCKPLSCPCGEESRGDQAIWPALPMGMLFCPHSCVLQELSEAWCAVLHPC